jgi:drug/metabolite transporter (DMT)-like permease
MNGSERILLAEEIGSVSRHKRSLRVALAAVLGLVVTVAPSLALLLTSRFTPGLGFILLFLALLLGSFVYTTVERPLPDWRHGVAFALVTTGAISALFLASYVQSPDADSTDRFLFGYVVLFIMVGTVIGMVGSRIASVASRRLLGEPADDKPRRLKPWHLGAAVAVVELAVVGAMAATSL